MSLPYNCEAKYYSSKAKNYNCKRNATNINYKIVIVSNSSTANDKIVTKTTTVRKNGGQL